MDIEVACITMTYAYPKNSGRRFNPAALIAAREKAGMSKEQLALIAYGGKGLHSNITAIESGARQPTRATIVRIAAALNVNPMDLLYRDERDTAPVKPIVHTRMHSEKQVQWHPSWRWGD